MNSKFIEIVSNKEYRERVIKYFNLPIRLSVSFEKFMSDLDFIKQVNNDKYLQVINYTVSDFNAISQGLVGEVDFSMEDIISPIVNEIENMESWKSIMEKDFSDTLSDYKGITNTHAFYKKENTNKHFLSIDLQTANWQSLQNITGITDDYEEFIVKHTDLLIPPISKTVRTKITALLNSKKIMEYNQYLLNSNKNKILDCIFNFINVDLRGKKPFAFYADEFLIEIDKETLDKFNEIDLNLLENKVFNETNVKIHLRPFTLKWMNINKGCIKEYKDNFQFINISKDIALILQKRIHGIQINEIDFEGIKLKETKEEFINKIDMLINQHLSK